MTGTIIGVRKMDVTRLRSGNAPSHQRNGDPSSQTVATTVVKTATITLFRAADCHSGRVKKFSYQRSE